MARLILMAGLPRAGKSTWARRQGHPIVCPDAIRLSLHGQSFYENAEPLVWAFAQIMMRALFHAGHKIVILDACNLTAKRRLPWERWCEKHGIECTLHVIATPASECWDRARLSGREDLFPIIERMAEETDLEEIT